MQVTQKKYSVTKPTIVQIESIGRDRNYRHYVPFYVTHSSLVINNNKRKH